MVQFHSAAPAIPLKHFVMPALPRKGRARNITRTYMLAGTFLTRMFARRSGRFTKPCGRTESASEEEGKAMPHLDIVREEIVEAIQEELGAYRQEAG